MSNDEKAECTIYNLGFMTISNDHLGCLIKAGFNIDANKPVTNQLPMIGVEECSETVRFIVRETIKAIDVNSTDIYMVSGVPDVSYYVITELIRLMPEGEIPQIFMPIGRHISGKFRVRGFRQIIVPGVDKAQLIRLTYDDRR